MPEVWKSVKNYPMYQVSNLGRIRSYHREPKPKILSPGIRSYEYHRLALYNKNSQRRNTYVHILIAEAFLGPRPDGYVCNHKDGIKKHDEASNLEWISRSEDTNHAHRLNLIPTVIRLGEDNSNSKLKNGEIWLIKKLLLHGIKQIIIARMFKITRGYVSHILLGHNWKHIKYEERK